MWKVIKGKTITTAELDSTHTRRKTAVNRRRQLLDGLRGTRRSGDRIDVWVVEALPDDPVNYQKVREDRNFKGYRPQKIR